MIVIVDMAAEIKNGKLISPEDGTDFSKIIVDSNCQFKVINEMGPGGGWPEIEISGNRQDLMPLLYNLGYDDIDEIYIVNE